MDEFSGFVLFLVMAGLGFSVLYVVVRRAVADGIRYARGDADRTAAPEIPPSPM